MKHSGWKSFGKFLILTVLAVVVLVLVFWLLFCRERPPSLYQETHLIMGTYITVEVRSSDTRLAKESVEDAFRAIRRVDELMSIYKPESQVSLLNRRAWQSPMKVDPLLFRVLQKSLDVADISGGAFDITVKPMLDLWKRYAQAGSTPPDEEIRKARELVGSSLIELNEPSEVTFKKQGVQIDLGGIAKGFAADLAVDRLKAHGISAGLVEAGGDIRLYGGTEQEPWRIAIQNPFSEGIVLPYTIFIREGAVVTSGNYRRGYSVEGKRYSHIIDPRSGLPAEGVSSVTVIAKEAAFADGLATALSVLGFQKGLELASTIEGVECLIIKGDENKPIVGYTWGFEDYLEGTVADGTCFRRRRIAR